MSWVMKKDVLFSSLDDMSRGFLQKTMNRVF